MDNNTTQHDIVMFKLNNVIEFIRDAGRIDLMDGYYSQFNGMIDLARSLDIISLEEQASIVNEVHVMMAKKIVEEGWN